MWQEGTGIDLEDSVGSTQLRCDLHWLCDHSMSEGTESHRTFICDGMAMLAFGL